jgi:peptidoglycan/xylan/chitin deacetylase (PgdA/CDA1 family)
MHKMLLLGLVLCVQLAAGSPLWAGQVTSFIYHRFDEFRYPSTNISSEIFKQQLAVLKAQNYQVLSLGEVARRLSAGEALPDKGAAISIDDAFSSFIEVAMPILREYDFPATLFVNSDAVGTPGYLDWTQLKQLYDEGIEIGNHTATHDYLVESQVGETLADWQQRVEQDIGKARGLYEKHLGPVPKIFAYPYGEYTPELMQILEGMGFDAAFAQQSGVIHAQSSRFALPRFPMGGPYATLAGFRNKLAMKPLVIISEDPVSPVLIANPPILKIQSNGSAADLRQLNCFVQGENSCKVEPISARPGWFQVVADKPLTGRRNKYTLTAQGRQGWYWYSHLWVRAKTPVGVVDGAFEKLTTRPQIDGSEAGQAVYPDQRL